MTAAFNSEARKRLTVVPEPADPLTLIHEFENAIIAQRDLLRPLSEFDLARRNNALNALLVAMGEPPLYGESA